jgi:nitroreductase
MKKSIEINGHRHVLFTPPPINGMNINRAVADHYRVMSQRRSIRTFSEEPIDRDVIEKLILIAGTAPSGAHKQPWTFCAISDPEMKKQIRAAVEAEEYENYTNRMSEQWIDDLQPMGTDHQKPFIEEAPWLIVLCKQVYGMELNGKATNYYVNESVGIAAGMLISAIHQAGLVTLTHTPAPMNFLTKILNRPENERAYLLLPVGYPKEPSYVPDLKRKGLDEISVFY